MHQLKVKVIRQWIAFMRNCSIGSEVPHKNFVKWFKCKSRERRYFEISIRGWDFTWN